MENSQHLDDLVYAKSPAEPKGKQVIIAIPTEAPYPEGGVGSLETSLMPSQAPFTKA